MSGFRIYIVYPVVVDSLSATRKDVTRLTIGEVFAKFWPLIAIQLVLMVAALLDIRKRRVFKGLPKTAWIVIVIVGQTLGPLAYFLWGRGEE